VLREAMRDWLPAEVLSRSKMGFPVPIGRWFRTHRRYLVDEFVLGERAAARGLFQRPFVERIAHEHVSGLANHDERLWALINVEVWHRIFVDGCAPSDVAMTTAAHPARA